MSTIRQLTQEDLQNKLLSEKKLLTVSVLVYHGEGLQLTDTHVPVPQCRGQVWQLVPPTLGSLDRGK